MRCPTRRSWPRCSTATVSEAPLDAVGAAVAALADDPYPAAGFHRGRNHRLRAGAYRILYVVDDDVISVERVDRGTGR